VNTFENDARPPRKYGGYGRFEDRLAFGDNHELAVAKWLETKGRRVTRLALGACDDGGGPKLHTINGSATAPELLVVKPGGGKTKMLEVKGKTAATWHRFGSCWETAISLLELRRYEEAEHSTGLPVWLGFVMLGRGDRFVERAPPPPSGFFVTPVSGLMQRASHTYGRGDAAMIYWRLDDLCRLASLEDLGLVL